MKIFILESKEHVSLKVLKLGDLVTRELGRKAVDFPLIKIYQNEGSKREEKQIQDFQDRVGFERG